MLLRVFGYIWGTLLLTMLLFAGLVSALDWSAPESALRRIDRELIQRDLTAIIRAEGVDAARSHWQRIAAEHPAVTVSLADACAPAETCVQVTLPSGIEAAAVDVSPFLLPLLVGSAVSALAAIALSQWLTRPIRTVNAALQRLADGHLDTRIGQRMQTGNREISQLAEAFDHAAERLQALTDSRQRLFHDVSHEIRSPLARLRAALGLMPLRPDRLPTLQAQMEGDVARLDELVDGILTLARFEADDLAAGIEPLDLLDVLEPILADAAFEGEPRGITLAYSGAESLPLNGHPEMLHRAMENVLRNALAYSPDGGAITVRGWHDATHVMLEVADSGPGMDPGEFAELLHPFRRGPGSEGRRGTGLGLAITAKAVRLHDGQIEAERGHPAGAVIRLRLPRPLKSWRPPRPA